MNDSISNKTSSFPSVCNYIPQESYSQEESIVYEQTDFASPPPPRESKRMKQIRNTALAEAKNTAFAKTPQEVKEEVLASMTQTLLKTIASTSIALINSHMEILKKQYEAFEEEMKAIERKHA